MTENSMTVSPFVAYVGIDWADKAHAVCELSQDGSRIHALEVDQSPEAIAEWLKRLRALCDQGPIAIGLELSRGGLVAALLQYDGLVLFPVNPKQLSRNRDAMIPSGAKNDPDDAKLLAEFIRDHHSRLRPWIPDDGLHISKEAKRTYDSMRCNLAELGGAVDPRTINSAPTLTIVGPLSKMLSSIRSIINRAASEPMTNGF